MYDNLHNLYKHLNNIKYLKLYSVFYTNLIKDNKILLPWLFVWKFDQQINIIRIKNDKKIDMIKLKLVKRVFDNIITNFICNNLYNL